MSALTFPQNPQLGQEFVATNGVTYTWLGYWSSSSPMTGGNSYFVYEGGDAVYDVTNDINGLELDGGNA